MSETIRANADDAIVAAEPRSRRACGQPGRLPVAARAADDGRNVDFTNTNRWTPDSWSPWRSWCAIGVLLSFIEFPPAAGVTWLKYDASSHAGHGERVRVRAGRRTCGWASVGAVIHGILMADFSGAVMNILVVFGFVWPAAFLYAKRHTFKGAVAGLAVSVVAATVMAIVGNLLVTPAWLGVPLQGGHRHDRAHSDAVQPDQGVLKRSFDPGGVQEHLQSGDSQEKAGERAEMTSDPVAGLSKTAEGSPAPEVRGIAETARTEVREPSGPNGDRMRGEAAAATRLDDRQVVEFKGAGFTYDGETFVFEGLDLNVRQGQFVCLLGGNGSGKSDARQARERPAHTRRGKRACAGTATRATATRRTSSAATRAGVPEPRRPAGGKLGGKRRGLRPGEPGRAHLAAGDAREALARRSGAAGIRARETKRAFRGQKQRVAIAGVLAMNPQILVLDEASAMLDPRGRAGLLRVCQELHERGMTIVMITHFMEEAALADRVVVLDGGRVRLDGTPERCSRRASCWRA